MLDLVGNFWIFIQTPHMKYKISKDVILIIALSILFIIDIPLIFGIDPFKDYMAFMSTASTIVTMLFAFFIYDKFDSKKAAFNKEVDAVENLTQSLIWMHLKFVRLNRKDIVNKRPDDVSILTTADFYLNWYNIDDKKKFHHDLPNRVLFTDGALKEMGRVAQLAQNPWIPRDLSNLLKPLIIFSEIKLDYFSSSDENVIVVKTQEEKIHMHTSFYRVYYDVRNESLTIESFGDYIDKWEKVLTYLEEYYKNRFGDSPNFDGD